MCASADASSPNCVTGFDAIFQFKRQASDIPTCGLYLVLQNLRSGHVRLGRYSCSTSLSEQASSATDRSPRLKPRSMISLKRRIFSEGPLPCARAFGTCIEHTAILAINGPKV